MTDEERQRRIALNEALYRQVNERVESVNAAFGALTGDLAVICECGILECQEQISVPPDVYERARSNPARFVVLAGHEIDDEEDVVEVHDGYLVVEKMPPEGRRIAFETDPRS